MRNILLICSIVFSQIALAAVPRDVYADRFVLNSDKTKIFVLPSAAGGNVLTDNSTISNSATTATSANTASAIVARNASGNFSAGTITATLSGNATNITGVAAITNGGTNNASLSVTGGTTYYADGTKVVGLANGSAGQALTSAGGTSAPTWATLAAKTTGEVFMTAKTSCPTGTIATDGSSLLRTGGTSCGGGSCATLFAAISTTYGSVDGTHFTLPDMRGVFPRGAGSQTISSITYTGTQGTTQGDQMQGHIHNIDASFGSLSGSGTGALIQVGSRGTTGPVTDGVNGTPRTGSETRPANISFLYCIVY